VNIHKFWKGAENNCLFQAVNSIYGYALRPTFMNFRKAGAALPHLSAAFQAIAAPVPIL
jgi:hypothetical protein